MIFVVLSIFPKTLIAWDAEKYNELCSTYSERNNRLHLSLGERVYDKSFNRVFDAIVIGLPDVGLTVKNMEKSSGYISGEGKYTMPLNEYMKMNDEMFQEIKDVSGRKFTITGYDYPDLNISISLIPFANYQTKVKIRITAKYPWVYPPFLESTYRGIWRTIERQVFLDENLDGNDNNESTVKISPRGLTRKK